MYIEGSISVSVSVPVLMLMSAPVCRCRCRVSMSGVDVGFGVGFRHWRCGSFMKRRLLFGHSCKGRASVVNVGLSTECFGVRSSEDDCITNTIT